VAAFTVVSAMHARMEEWSVSMNGVASLIALAFLFPTGRPRAAGAAVAFGSNGALALARAVRTSVHH
jgi:hypothetical protein